MKLYDPSTTNEPISGEMRGLEITERLPNYRLCKKKMGNWCYSKWNLSPKAQCIV